MQFDEDYIQVGVDTFWQWEDQGEVLTIIGGNTVVYTNQLMQILELLSEQGLPVLGSLVLVLVATHPERHTMLADIKQRWLQTDQSSTRLEYTDAMAFLQQIAYLPPVFHTGKNRFLLLQTIFQKAHNTINSRRSKQILNTLKAKNSIPLVAGVITEKRMLKQEIKVIQLLYRHFPDSNSILKAMSDTHELPDSILIDDPVAKKPTKDFIEQLLQHHQTFEAAALINLLWAGLHIPYRQTSPSQHPIGGVSDLTNKGELSQLLISEFANDDLLFLSRLANNEALYLNREIPPDNDQKTRLILIDTSVKSWGTPKTIGFAIAIAIARHPKATTQHLAYTIGNQYHAVDLNAIDSIINGLQHVEVCLSPEKGFMDVMALHSDAKQIEVFLITTAKTLNLPTMQQLMSIHQHRLTYLILTDSSGQLSLYRQYAHRRKHIQHMQLPLDELWRKKTPPQVTEPPTQPTRKSLIGQCPLLFPVNPNWRNFLTTGNDVAFCITPECLLLQHTIYKNPYTTGWRLVMDELPYKSGQSEIGQLTNGDYVLLQFRHATKKLHRLNLTANTREEIDYPHWSGKKFPAFFYDSRQEAFYHLTSRDTWKITATGTVSAVNETQSNRSALIDQYNSRTQQLQALQQLQWGHKTILQHVHFVCLTDRMTFVLNTHELQFNDDTIRFTKAGNIVPKATAVLRTADTFVFPDGSSITIHSAGMLILASSKKELPTLFIPAVLDDFLGIATTAAFAGNTYFLSDEKTLERCSEKMFRQRFIQPFIKTIASHGTNA